MLLMGGGERWVWAEKEAIAPAATPPTRWFNGDRMIELAQPRRNEEHARNGCTSAAGSAAAAAVRCAGLPPATRGPDAGARCG